MYIDPAELVEAIEDQVRQPPLDFRTRLLIRDSLNALERRWGGNRVASWLAESPSRQRLESIRDEDLGRPGFSFLEDQLVDPTRPEAIKQLLRELGQSVHHPVKMFVGDSVALIVPGYLSRRSQYLDVIDEVPAEIRNQHQLIQNLTQRHRLQIAHFQSHHLPSGWQNRVHSIEPFGALQVYLVDAYDVLVSKLFSGREKDRDDLRIVLPRLDKDVFVRRVRDNTASLRSDSRLLKQAEQNWYILFGDSLPT